MKKEKTILEHIIATIVFLVVAAILLAIGGYIVVPIIEWLAILASNIFDIALCIALVITPIWLVWLFLNSLWRSKD